MTGLPWGYSPDDEKPHFSPLSKLGNQAFSRDLPGKCMRGALRRAAAATSRGRQEHLHGVRAMRTTTMDEGRSTRKPMRRSHVEGARTWTSRMLQASRL